MRLKYTTLLILNNYGIQLVHPKFFYHVHKFLIMYWIFFHTKQMAHAIAVGAAKFWHVPLCNGTHRISQSTFDAHFYIGIWPARHGWVWLMSEAPAFKGQSTCTNGHAGNHFAMAAEVIEVPMHFLAFSLMTLNAFRKVCLGGADIHVIPCIKMHHALGADFEI